VRWTLPHPDDPTVRARYGHDPERGGVWCELTYNEVLVAYDMTDAYDVEAPIHGLLTFMSQFGFFDGHDVDAAFEWLGNSHDENLTMHGWPSGPRRAPKRLRRVIDIIENLRAAGE
jgi:hypothetical protein